MAGQDDSVRYQKIFAGNNNGQDDPALLLVTWTQVCHPHFQVSEVVKFMLREQFTSPPHAIIMCSGIRGYTKAALFFCAIFGL